MAKQTLNLGAILSDLIKNANSNFTELYNAIATIQETLSDAGEKAVVFSSVNAMISGLNEGKDEAGNTLDITVGDEIYILDDETPDFWVSAVSTTSSIGTKPATWEKNTNYTFGKYTIRVSKSREIDLTDYQKITNLVSTIDENSSDKLAPTAKAVYNAIKDFDATLKGVKVSTAPVINVNTGGSGVSGTSPTDNTIPTSKAVADSIGNAFNNIGTATSEDAGFMSAEDKANLDKLQTAYENGTIGGSVDLSGYVTNEFFDEFKDSVEEIIISADQRLTALESIKIEDLKSGYIEVTPQAVTLNSKSYKAIVVNDTDVTLEVLNSSGQAVVTQVIRANGKIYYCLPSTDTNTYTLRKVGGNGVSGSSKLYRHRIYMSMTGGAYMVLVYYNRSSAQVNEIEATWNGIPVVGMHGSTLSPILHVDFNYENRNQKVKIYTVANQAGAEVYYENINVIDTVEEVV